MPEKNKNIIQYSAADIQKYLEGKLSSQEMNAIEKAALDDPFLADAIEGIQNNQTHFANDVTELKKKLEEKLEKNKKATIIPENRLWQRIAAIAIILIGSFFLIYNFLIINSSKKKNAIAKNAETAIIDSSAIPKASSASAPKNDSAVIKNDVAINKKYKLQESENQFSDKSAAKKNRVIKEQKEKKIDEKPVALSDTKNKADNGDAATQADTLNQTASINAPKSAETELQGKASGLVRLRKSIEPKNFVEGRVVDKNKNPVAGATVIIKNKNNGTVTDQNGYFKINTLGNDSVAKVVINSVGFEPTSATLNNNDILSNQIQLRQSNTSLNEVVVVGLTADKKSSSTDDEEKDEQFLSTAKKELEKAFNAAPANGWAAYNEYINQNKKISTADSTIRGKEIISFIIDRNNQLSSFKIKTSLSKSHDAEAIRLVQQGPSWKLLKGKKEKITLAIEF
ncbi:MAG TPA: carboxypeptidase-like regulatory domain-containing protein [Puia sp.]|nr:carboxypeptidase-like regulatory domain-containing protein [Puia sp.]